jgi:hypothetical protein
MKILSPFTQMTIHRITTTAEPINLEDQYCESLDENYSSSSFCSDFHLTPSRVLKEVDLTAYNEGLSNYADSCEAFVEIDGNWYDRYEVSRIKAEIIEEIDDLF